MLFKGYFDGGNDPSNPHDRYVTLTAIYSDKASLRALSCDWVRVLAKHSVDYLHTTDDVKAGRHKLLSDCVDLIAEHVVKDGSFRGIIPTPVTVDAREFRSVRNELPNGPQILSEGLAIHSLHRVIQGCREIARRHQEDNTKIFYDLYFDRGEPYRGHIIDRFENQEFKRWAIEKTGIDIERYFQVHPPSDCRDFPELQVADLFSWCHSRYYNVRFEWQHRLLEIKCDGQRITRNTLINPNLATLDIIKSLRLPKRAKK